MSAGIYANINGVTRKGKKLYAKVNGVIRPIKELWVKDNGVARCVYRAMPQIIDVKMGTMDECNITYEGGGGFKLELEGGNQWNPDHIVHLEIRYDRPFTIKQATVYADYYQYKKNVGSIQHVKLYPYGFTGDSKDCVTAYISNIENTDGIVSKTKEFDNVRYDNSKYICFVVSNDTWESSSSGTACLRVSGYVETVEYGRIYV